MALFILLERGKSLMSTIQELVQEYQQTLCELKQHREELKAELNSTKRNKRKYTLRRKLCCTESMIFDTAYAIRLMKKYLDE